MRILITCFEPFGCDVENSSQIAVEQLPDTIGNHQIVKHIIPVSFNRAPEIMRRLCTEVRPDIILMTGQAARANVCLERLAINWAISTNTDNDGVRAQGRRIYSDGPDAIITKLPVDDIALTLSGLGMPVKVSNTAGTFVCNRLYFETLLTSASVPALFIHLPLTPSQAAKRNRQTPSLPASSSVSVIRQLISIIANNRDIKPDDKTAHY